MNEKTKTMIISGFPGIGKSYLFHNSSLNILDSDSSNFDKKYFPGNYIKHIKHNIMLYDVILVSSHGIVREALVGEKIEFLLVYPNIDMKEEFIERYKLRGNNEGFINLLDVNWNDWITQMQKQDSCKKIELSTGQYLSDVI